MILHRANIFFVANGVGNATSVVGPIICASLMRNNIWSPIWLALFLQMVSILSAFGLPETLPVSGSIDSYSLPSFPTHCQHDSSTSVSLPPAKTSNIIYAEMATSFKALAIIFGDWRMVVLACLYPVRMMYTVRPSRLVHDEDSAFSRQSFCVPEARVERPLYHIIFHPVIAHCLVIIQVEHR